MVIIVLASACGFEHGRAGAGSNGVVDAPRAIDAAIDTPDGPPPPPDARACFGTFINICLTATPPMTYMVDAVGVTAINTDTTCTQVVAQTMGPALCVIAANQITINSHLQVSGSRALVLLATDSLSIGATGLVDVGSYRSSGNEVLGAGFASGPALCGTPTDGQVNANGGAGGGAGGSFAGSGGTGARGQNSAGGLGGAPAAAVAAPSFLRGGCRGTSGGGGMGGSGGAAATGGGAALLIAGTSITNAGHVRANGMGGYGGQSYSGGGGGGSGGMLVLDAPTVTNSGILNANGGAGGEGGGTQDPGAQGASGLAGTAAATTFDYNPNGGNGGNGSYGGTLTGSPGATAAAGGGAGGGGAGVIRVYPAQQLAGVVSPPTS